MSLSDLVFLVGCAAAAAGIWWLSPPACLIVVGVGLAFAAVRWTRSRAR